MKLNDTSPDILFGRVSVINAVFNKSLSSAPESIRTLSTRTALKVRSKKPKKPTE